MLVDFGLDESKISVVYNGVDMDRFKPGLNADSVVSRHNLKGKKVLLTVSRLKRYKGHDTVINLMPSLLKRFPGLVYIIVGEGSDRDYLEALVSSLNLRGNVIFAGNRDKQDLPLYHNICDVYIMLTKERGITDEFEGFGLVFLEASSCGKPVIGANTGGIPDTIVHGKTGYLVDPNNSEEIKHKIITLLEDRGLAERMGTEGRSRILREDLTWESAAKKIRDILETEIKKTGLRGTLKGENIVIFSSADWKTPRPTAPTHLALNFAKDNKVLFVETFGSRIPSLNLEHVQRLGRRIGNWLRGIRRREAERLNLSVYSPTAIMLNFRPFLYINRLIFLSIFNRLINKLDMKDPIVFFYIPPPLGTIKKLKAKAIIYHCIDEWVTYPGGKNRIFMDSEKELIEKADLVIVTNDLLYENKKSSAKKIHKMYHGVDYDHFSKAFSDEQPLPDGMEGIPKPIIAIVGSFVDWMDLELIKLIAERHPEWSMVSIGPVDSNVEINDLTKMDNVYFLSAKEYSELPNYHRAVDVFIVPFLLTEHIKYCAPTRLYEHLASGKPIVTTDFPAAHDVGEGVISIASDRQDFVRRIEEALSEKEPLLSEKRKCLARANTWRDRIEKISTLIEEVAKK